MTPFEAALAEEEKWICNVANQPMPTDDRAGHRVYIGPTLPVPATLAEREQAAERTPASMRPKNQPKTRKPPGEDEEWKRIRQDLRARLHGHTTPRYD